MRRLILYALSVVFVVMSLMIQVSAAEPELFPVNAEQHREGRRREIIRVYELGEGENSSQISLDSFSRDGFRFELSELTRQEVRNYSTREWTETVTINTQSNDLATVMRELAAEMYFEHYGYYGVLTLDVGSINIQSLGTQSSSHIATRIREYPHLSSPDTSLVPRTITEGGRTFELSNVEWHTQTTATVDYRELPASFTAIATYTGTEIRTSNIGFVTTAQYRGALTRTDIETIQYTVRFTGTRRMNWWLVAGAIAFFIFMIAYITGKKGKKKPSVKKITSVVTVFCLLIVGISQTAYASEIPRYGFGRQQTAVHINPQAPSGAASGNIQGAIHFNPQAISSGASTGTAPGIVGAYNSYVYGTRIGRLTVERLGRNVNIYGGATMRNMDFGGAHFSFTGLTSGNVGLIGHNRGSNGFFSFVRLLRVGDVMTFYTGDVTRRYAVVNVFTINETDFSYLTQFGDNRLTLITCVEYQPRLRRVAVALEI